VFASSYRGRLRDSIKAAVKASARDNIKFVEPTVTAIGAVSKLVERRVREKLSVPPPILEFCQSPTGALLIEPMKMNPCGGRDYISTVIYYRGWAAFEHPFPSLLEAVLVSAPDGLFFDVGANTGLYSLLSKAICRDRGVHAFEPFPPALDALRTNIALNRFAADIVVAEAATSDETGIAELFIPTQEHGLVETSSSLSSTFKSQHSEVVPVKTIKLDDYCRQIGLGSVAVMKIDVEGAEEKVLRGAAELMARDKPIIFCEILPNAGAWSVLPAMLARTGYMRGGIHPKALVIQEDAGPDPTAHNHILFPRSLEPIIREAARSVNINYQSRSAKFVNSDKAF
jgi:FkbM family methyltransferase